APEVPTFAGAEDTRYTTQEWLNVVEQFSAEFGWSPYQRLRYAASRLTGPAKLWHQKAGEVFLSYDHWKAALLLAIPERRFTWDEKRRILERRQRVDETIEEYFIDKWSTASRFSLTLDDAREFLLRGLNQQDIAKSLAGRHFSSVASFITAAQEVSRIIGAAKEEPDRKGARRVETGNRRREEEPKPKSDTCAKCGQPGHRKRECTGDVMCYHCKQHGHISRQCPQKTQARQTLATREAARRPVTARVHQAEASDSAERISATIHRIGSEADQRTSRLTRRAKLNGIDIEMAIDTQSDISLVREDVVARVGPMSNPDARITITGITRDRLETKGYGLYDLELDGLMLRDVHLFAMPKSLLTAEVWLGKDVLDDQRISMVLHNGAAKFVAPPDLQYAAVEAPTKFSLQAKQPTVVPARATRIMKVTCEIDADGDFFIERTPLNANAFIPSCVLRADGGDVHLPVVNFSSTDLAVPINRLLARAHRVALEPPMISQGSPQTKKRSIELEDLNIGDQISKEDCRRLLELCNRYRQCFARNINEIGCHPSARMSIELTSDTIVNERRTPHSLAERRQVEGLVSELLGAGIIEPARSAFNSPLVVIRKKDRTHRVCVDYRRLNAITKKESFPTPFIDELVEETAGWRIFAILDLASGYYQIIVDEDSRDKTAFSTVSGQYQFKRMPFGLVNAPFVFNRVMEDSLRSVPPGTLKRYMDDLVIGARDFDELLTKLESTFIALTEAQLTLKLTKCHFGCSEVSFLGFRLSQEGLRPGEDKLRAIMDFPCPTNVREVRGFLGLCGYFRRFIAGFASIAAPMTALTKKNNRFEWTLACSDAFEELKSRLVTAPVLATFEADRLTEVHTDASHDGIGGVLMQKDDSGGWHPVTFVSRRTTPAEQKYHATELELLGAVWVISRLRMFLYGKEFTLVTDCEAVRQGLQKRTMVPRIARWVLQLLDFNFSVQHRPGRLMAHVDALSRQPIQSSEPPMDEVAARFEVWSIEATDDWIVAAQSKDECCTRMRDSLVDGKAATPDGRVEEIDGKMFFRPKGGRRALLIIPERLRRETIREIHEKLGHPGLDATVEATRHRFWFPKMRRTARSMIGACIPCLMFKQPGGRKPGFLNTITRKSKPFNTLHLDHVGPFPRSRAGRKFLLVGVCNFTKMVFLRAVTSTSSKHTIKAVRGIIEAMWIPDRIVTDRGTAFKNGLFEDFCRRLQIELIFTSTCNPRANGQVERLNRTIVPMIASRCVKDDGRDWDEHVTETAIAINSRVNRSTGMTPLEVMYGFRPRTLVDSLLARTADDAQTLPGMGCNATTPETSEDATKGEGHDQLGYAEQRDMARHRAHDMITRSQARYKEQFDRHRCVAKKLDVGDIVVVRRPPATTDGQPKKLAHLYRGPYRITQRLRDDLYEIGSLSSKRRYTATAPRDQLKRWDLEDDAAVEDDDGDDSEGPEATGWPSVDRGRTRGAMRSSEFAPL
ncbi:hypothetical protein B4U79_15090, partial [Dinothrombium tinctorium]